MNKQSKNAERIVGALVGHERVERIHYPGLFEDPEQRRIYRAQCDYPGGIFSLELRGGKQAAFDFLRRLRITKNAVSLGAMESLACHPATTTHSEMTPNQLDRAGVTQGLVRVSVGIENWRDLLREYTEALGRHLKLTSSRSSTTENVPQRMTSAVRAWLVLQLAGIEGVAWWPRPESN